VVGNFDQHAKNLLYTEGDICPPGTNGRFLRKMTLEDMETLADRRMQTSPFANVHPNSWTNRTCKLITADMQVGKTTVMQSDMFAMGALLKMASILVLYDRSTEIPRMEADFIAHNAYIQKVYGFIKVPSKDIPSFKTFSHDNHDGYVAAVKALRSGESMVIPIIIFMYNASKMESLHKLMKKMMDDKDVPKDIKGAVDVSITFDEADLIIKSQNDSTAVEKRMSLVINDFGGILKCISSWTYVTATVGGVAQKPLYLDDRVFSHYEITPSLNYWSIWRTVNGVERDCKKITIQDCVRSDGRNVTKIDAVNDMFKHMLEDETRSCYGLVDVLKREDQVEMAQQNAILYHGNEHGNDVITVAWDGDGITFFTSSVHWKFFFKGIKSFKNMGQVDTIGESEVTKFTSKKSYREFLTIVQPGFVQSRDEFLKCVVFGKKICERSISACSSVGHKSKLTHSVIWDCKDVESAMQSIRLTGIDTSTQEQGKFLWVSPLVYSLLKRGQSVSPVVVERYISQDKGIHEEVVDMEIDVRNTQSGQWVDDCSSLSESFASNLTRKSTEKDTEKARKRIKKDISQRKIVTNYTSRAELNNTLFRKSEKHTVPSNIVLPTMGNIVEEDKDETVVSSITREKLVYFMKYISKIEGMVQIDTVYTGTENVHESITEVSEWIGKNKSSKKIIVIEEGNKAEHKNKLRVVMDGGESSIAQVGFTGNVGIFVKSFMPAVSTKDEYSFIGKDTKLTTSFEKLRSEMIDWYTSNVEGGVNGWLMVVDFSKKNGDVKEIKHPLYGKTCSFKDKGTDSSSEESSSGILFKKGGLVGKRIMFKVIA